LLIINQKILKVLISDSFFIEVLHPGMACSVQDQGRYGLLSEGIPIAGVMDQELAGIANLIVGNTPDSAVIEFNLMPPKLQFSASCQVAVIGFDIQVYLNTALKKTFQIIDVRKGEVLNLRLNKVGGYGYIAIAGGVETPIVLGSRSFFKHITTHNVMQKGMQLSCKGLKAKEGSRQFSKLKPLCKTSEVVCLKVYKGPEFGLLSTKEKNTFSTQLFSIHNQSNRMGFRLNEVISTHQNSMISSPVLPGTVQWTPSGSLIVLMRGYPRILQLKEQDISMLARVAPNGFIRFELI